MPRIDDNNVLHLLNQEIKPGERKVINLLTAKLYTDTNVNVPVIVEHAKTPGPVILITSGIHGDELNGVEVVRQIIAQKVNKPKKGTVICIPILNVFGFLGMSRFFPDGRDLNRMFPGSKKGSLASRFAYQFSNKILPIADLCLDFHSGGAKRFNAAQVRLNKGNAESLKYAKIFKAPFTVYSKILAKSYRSLCVKKDIPNILFEGGMSEDSNKEIAEFGVQGVMRILKHFSMLRSKFEPEPILTETIVISKSRWIRAAHSGMFHNEISVGDFVTKGDILGVITDPYGSFKHRIKASHNGYIINVNFTPIVYTGDAIYHLSKTVENDKS